MKSPKPNKALQSEVHEYLTISRQRKWIFPRAAFVGLLAGFLALLFRVVLAGADSFRNGLIDWAHRYPAWGWIFPVLFTLTCSVLAVFITRRFAPEAAGSGIPHLEAVLHRFRLLNWKSLLPVKFFGGILSIGGGLALGREGPTVQMGGAVGDFVSRILKVNRQERMTLISAGAGAGLSAAFNAPLSGLIFVLEEVRRDFQPVVFGAAFVAAAVANIVAQIGSGPFPVFLIPSYPVVSLTALPVFAGLGILSGFVGVLFNSSIMSAGALFGKIPSKWILPITALIGGAVGLLGWFNPLLIGSGHHLAESALKGEVALWLIPLFFLIRMVLTISNYSTGAPGGIFAPMLVFGSLLGLAVGKIAGYWFPDLVPVPGAFAVVGMAACFTAIVRAPLTGIVLIIEMTGNYSLMLPLLISCFCAYAAAELVKSKPVYESMLERELEKKGSVIPVPVEPQIMEFTVGEKSLFAGKKVRDMHLPTGCLIIRCFDGRKEWVPTADTLMIPHLRVTIVISFESPETLSLLHAGFQQS